MPCQPEPWRRLIRPSSSGNLEGGKQVRLVRRSLGGGGQRHVRQSRRAEPHSLPHVLWRPAYKVAAAGAASFDLPPRTAASVVPACRAEDGTASRHAPCFVAVRAPLSPKPVCATSCLGARSSHAARAAQPGLPLQTRRGRANLRGLRLSRHQLSPPEEDAVAIRFPSPEGSGGLGNELLFLVVLRETATPNQDSSRLAFPNVKKASRRIRTSVHTR